MSALLLTKHQVLDFVEKGRVRSLTCELRKSNRSRRINLRLKSPHFALLTFPKRMSWETAEIFLHKQKDWLQQKSLELPVSISLKQYFEEGGKICLCPSMGARKVSVFTDDHTDRPWVSLENQEIGIQLPPCEQEDYKIKLACRKLAHQFLPGWIEWAEEKAGLYSNRLRVGDQQTRWGSCSPRGTISLNWRIILLPVELGNYVIFHELAHLAEMNHSGRFWAKLEEFVPNARAVDRELSKVGKPVFALGRVD